MGPLLNIATKAALSAGKIITRFYEQLPERMLSQKADRSFVTQVDHEVEAEIIQTIRTAYPNHGFITEESEAIAGDDYTWIIDPIDGTLNFIRSIPHFCISIALQHKGRISHALVYDPIHQDLFTAARGKGAQLNNRRIRVKDHNVLTDALVSGILPSFTLAPSETSVAAFTKIYEETSDIRRTGSSALDLAYVAAGRLDAFWANDLKIWDVAASSLLVEEAGGLISDWSGNPDYLKTEGCQVLAANPKLFKQILPLVQQAYPSL